MLKSSNLLLLKEFAKLTDFAYLIDLGNSGLPSDSFGFSVGGVDSGSEVDLVASYKINEHFNLAAKYATCDGANRYADRKKFWLQPVFKY